ncbi:MAG: NUDIX domain-containing protein [Candidatus Thorarchaeota archaeon]|nr:NUDIX domain-containing protein [Candidatus Thorarchaeota archaeon]
MAIITPIAITILKCKGSYLFIKRNRSPYENLFSFVGGKVEPGEHIKEAAIREVTEETKAIYVKQYEYLGVVSERLVDSEGNLLDHFLIFVNSAVIQSFQEKHREGAMALFSVDDIRQKKDAFLPSDWQMFMTFEVDDTISRTFEAELVHLESGYTLEYFRKV